MVRRRIVAQRPCFRKRCPCPQAVHSRMSIRSHWVLHEESKRTKTVRDMNLHGSGVRESRIAIHFVHGHPLENKGLQGIFRNCYKMGTHRAYYLGEHYRTCPRELQHTFLWCTCTELKLY